MPIIRGDLAFKITPDDIEPDSIDEFEIESILRHKNDKSCGYDHYPHLHFWTEWSDYDIDNIDIESGCDPMKIDFRQKSNQFEWFTSGNILLHRKRYGTYNELQQP